MLHKDSQNPNHYCLFTQLNQQSLLAAFKSAAAPEPPRFTIHAHAVITSALLPSFDYVVSDGRAPPFVFSSIAVVG